MTLGAAGRSCKFMAPTWMFAVMRSVRRASWVAFICTRALCEAACRQGGVCAGKHGKDSHLGCA